MSVYVDPLFDTTHMRSANWRFTQSCHMTADSPEELMTFARRLGLSPAWVQHPGKHTEHFDLTVNKRRQAIAQGAIEISGGEASAQLLKRMRG